MAIKIKKKPDCEEYTVWYGKNYLGDIGKKKGGKRFWFFPDDFSMIGDMWFSEECLMDIAYALIKLNKDGFHKQ